jgi:hypothetical protein
MSAVVSRVGCLPLLGASPAREALATIINALIAYKPSSFEVEYGHQSTTSNISRNPV